MSSNQRQSGSAHVVIIIILILAILGLLGFVFWQNFIQKKDTNPAKSSAVTSTQTTADPYSGWQTYTYKKGYKGYIAFTLRYPSGWKENDISADTSDFATFVSPNIADETKGSLDAVQYDISLAMTKQSGSNPGTDSNSIITYVKDMEGQGAGLYANKTTESINGTLFTEFDIVGVQVPYFTAVTPIGDSYLAIDFVQTPTHADLDATERKILASFTVS